MTAGEIKLIQLDMRNLYKHLRSGRWAGATERTFAALYGWCHKRVWGRWPYQYSGPEITMVAKYAGKFMRACFFNDPYDMAHYMRWCFMREKELKKKRELRSTKLHYNTLFQTNNMLIIYNVAMDLQARKNHETIANMQ